MSLKRKVNQFNRWKAYLGNVAPRNALIYMEDQGVKARFFLRIGNRRTPVFRVHINSKPSADYLKFCNWISRRQSRTIGKHFQFNPYSKYGRWENPRRRKIRKAMKKPNHHRPHGEAIRRRHEFYQSLNDNAFFMYSSLWDILTAISPLFDLNGAFFSEETKNENDLNAFFNATMMLVWDMVALKHSGRVKKSFTVHICGPFALKAIHSPTEKDIYNWNFIFIDCSNPDFDEYISSPDNKEVVLMYRRKIVRYIRRPDLYPIKKQKP